jgi:hypothetical protein
MQEKEKPRMKIILLAYKEGITNAQTENCKRICFANAERMS